jgi:Uma2 family endonuclease
LTDQKVTADALLNSYFFYSINGAPDFIIEVLSPSNSLFEMSMKESMYELSGVKEYCFQIYLASQPPSTAMVNPLR